MATQFHMHSNEHSLRAWVNILQIMNSTTQKYIMFRT